MFIGLCVASEAKWSGIGTYLPKAEILYASSEPIRALEAPYFFSGIPVYPGVLIGMRRILHGGVLFFDFGIAQRGNGVVLSDGSVGCSFGFVVLRGKGV